MAWLKQLTNGIQISVKVVPGASRDRIAGLMGDALKVQVAAPPEKGKANAAVAALLAKALNVSPKNVTIIRGQTSPRKTVLVTGITIEEAQQRIGL